MTSFADRPVPASTPGPDAQADAAARSRTVLVLGAAGRIGAASALAFAAAGWRVLAQARKPLPFAVAGVEHLPLALQDSAALAGQARGAQCLVYGINPVYTRWPQDLLPFARQGMDLAESLGARFLLPGNVYGYGESMPPRLDERTPQQAHTRKGRLRMALEDELRARAQQGRLQASVIRAGDFYGDGPGATGTWLDLAIAKDLRRGKLVYPGPLDVPHAWAYLPDLARAFVAAAGRAQAPAWESLGFAGHAWSGRELLAAIEAWADARGLRPAHGWRHGSMPWPVLRAGGWVVPMWRELAEMAYLWRVPHAIDGGQLAATLGPLPQTPREQALARTLDALFPGR